MKRVLLSSVFICIAVLISSNLFAQVATWEQAVKEIKGDTVVINGTNQGGFINTIYVAVTGDTTATGERTNVNRVYETVPGGVYIQDGRSDFDATIPVFRLTAQPVDWSGDVAPPLLIKQPDVTGSLAKTFFQFNQDAYIDNQYLCLTMINDALDREVQRIEPVGARTEYDHCIFEFTNWVLLFPHANHQTFKMTNSLFINVGHEPTIEKGIVFDSWFAVDTLWMENNTVLNAGGAAIGRTPNHNAPNFAYFNHNTFVNMTLSPFLFNTQAEMIASNNLIINSGLTPDYPGFYEFYEDPDQLPKGIINADTVNASWIADTWPDGYPVDGEANRKIWVNKNDVWWDQRFYDMFDNQLPAIPDSIGETWASQFIKMNSRTQAMFDDDASYPYFVEGTWYEKDPGFTNNKDLVPEWISFIVSNITPGDPNGGDNMPWWRTNMSSNLAQVDWPPLADLSYSDSELMTGGTDGFPVGDLKWFPDKKAEWMSTNQSAKLIAAMKSGTATGIESIKRNNESNVTVYPNPVSITANVKFELRSDSNVKLAVYNIVGEKVKVQDYGRQIAGVHTLALNRGDLNSGVYILRVIT